MSCTSAPGFKGEVSDHFDGKHFSNNQPMDKSAGDMVKFGWGALTSAADWPDWIDIEPQAVPHERVREGISVTFINHATFLIQVDGINILTDPVYSERVSPVQWAGPKRVHAPGVALEDLPPIDVILISHNHYDHLDEATLRSLLDRQEQPPLLLAGLGNGDITHKVKNAILELLPDGRMSDAKVAETLFMSNRNLQRKLEAQGTTFKTILTELRKELASKYIQDPQLTLTEVSFMLGFSEMSAFSRAFKQWTGQSPKAQRQSQYA